mmetsp:Transcript_6359/g.23512  ORF Transcript_6359/g.23512 Transcript_6359/m.23512 type:complete len:239 (+) Transcript_6359:716-1432(+)
MLARTQTREPSNSSKGMNLTKPLTIWRGFSSPTSISSTYKESASGCFHAFTTLPTLTLSRATSTGPSGTLVPPPLLGLPPTGLPLLSNFFALLAGAAAGALVSSEDAPPNRARYSSISSSSSFLNSGSGLPIVRALTRRCGFEHFSRSLSTSVSISLRVMFIWVRILSAREGMNGSISVRRIYTTPAPAAITALHSSAFPCFSRSQGACSCRKPFPIREIAMSCFRPSLILILSIWVT